MEIFQKLMAYQLLEQESFSITERRALHKDVVFLGRHRNHITYKILEYLPIIFKHKIHRDHGCATIEEYAGKFAGIAKSTVKKRLNLERHLQNTPALKKVIGTQGVHKVALVAKLVTPENEEKVVQLVENMSKSALTEWAKEERHQKSTPQKMQIDFDPEMQFLFNKLKNKLGKNMSNKTVLRTILQKIAAQEFPEKKTRKQKAKSVTDFPGKISRYIPIEKKHQALSTTNGRCSHSNCNRPSENFHHQIPFSISKSHDSIIPICKIHHEFAHNGLTTPLTETDQLYRKHRQEALL